MKPIRSSTNSSDDHLGNDAPGYVRGLEALCDAVASVMAECREYRLKHRAKTNAYGDLARIEYALKGALKAAHAAQINAAPPNVGDAPVAWMWEYVGTDLYPKRHSKIARAISEMNPHNPPYPDTWLPLFPLYEKPNEGSSSVSTSPWMET